MTSMLALVLLIASVFGVAPPSVGSDCEDALAQLVNQKLEIRSVETVSGDPLVLLYTLSGKSKWLDRTALLVCGPPPRPTPEPE